MLVLIKSKVLYNINTVKHPGTKGGPIACVFCNAIGTSKGGLGEKQRVQPICGSCRSTAHVLAVLGPDMQHVKPSCGSVDAACSAHLWQLQESTD